MTARFSITINSVDYFIVPGTFVEGAVRRQAEFQQLNSEDLKSRPDVREWLQTSWLGGAEWAKPIYSSRNDDTYYDASGVSLTDTAGAVQQSATVAEGNSALNAPSSAIAAWTKNGIEGALAMAWSGTAWNWFEWDSATSTFITFSANYATLTGSDEVFAVSGGVGNLVYALMGSGYLAILDVAAATVSLVDLGIAVSNGSNLWVDEDYVWIYNGDLLYRCPIASSYTPEVMADDDLGLDVFSAGATFTGTPVIPEWSCRRAITTAEGIFYIKNVYQGGLPVCKVFRVDRDASGSYVVTPVTSLAAGTLGIDLAYHFSSLLISTVSNYYTAVQNTADQRVTIAHVTSGSAGAIGSPLGGDNLDETPVWFLGAYGEQYMFGGRKRIWQYDPRIGSFHPWYEVSGTKYTDSGAGFSDMAFVKLSGSSGIIFKHASQDGLSAAPYFLTADAITSTNTSSKNSFLESNWIDFNLPMEEKSITEIYYDSAFIRTGSTVQVQILADEGSFSTVLTLTGGTSDDTGRIAITPIKGYKFRYKLIFSDDTDVSSSDPSRLLALGFSATAGEMVEVMQFTIDGSESMNINNAVQVPKDVYDNIALLRANNDTFTVVHYYQSESGADSITKTMRVASITGNKEWPGEGMYDVVLMEVTSA